MELCFLKKEQITESVSFKISELNKIASERNETLARMSLAWILNDKRVTTVIVGSSSVRQLSDNLGVLDSPEFSAEHLNKIRSIIESD